MRFAFESVVVEMIGDVLQLATFVEIDSGTVGSIDDDELIDFAVVYVTPWESDDDECDDGIFNA